MAAVVLPPGVDCTAGCSALFDAGTVVSLTAIAEGATPAEGAVVLRARVSDPNDDEVRLQLEPRACGRIESSRAVPGNPGRLRALGGMGGHFGAPHELRRVGEGFTGVPTWESPLVTSRTIMSLTQSGLPAGSYRWRYRAIDAGGVVTDGVEFGTPGNTDFTITR